MLIRHRVEQLLNLWQTLLVHEQLKAALTVLCWELSSAGLNVVLLHKRVFEEVEVS